MSAPLQETLVDPMAEPKEVGVTAAAEKRAAKVIAAAAQLRDLAQAEYDAVVQEQQAAVSAHVEALNALDAAAAGVSAAAAQTLATMRQSAVSAHITAIAQFNEQLNGMRPQLDVAYWADEAEARVAAAEAQGG